MIVFAIRICLPNFNHRVGEHHAFAIQKVQMSLMCSPLTSGPAITGIEKGSVQAQVKKGPYCLRSSRDQIHLIPQREFLPGRAARYPSGIPATIQARSIRVSKSEIRRFARFFIRYGIVNGIEWKQGIIGKIHLSHKSLGKGSAEQRKMNVRGAPRIRMIPPGIGARLDRHEPVMPAASVRVRPQPVKLGSRGEGCWSFSMHIAATGVCLPDFDQCVGHRAAVVVEHPPGDADALPDRFAEVLARKIIIVLGDFVVAEDRSGDFRQRVWKQNQRFARRPENSRSIRRIQRRRLGIRVGMPIGPNNSGMLFRGYGIFFRGRRPGGGFVELGAS